MESCKEELLEELMVLQTLVDENPCRMKVSLLTSLKHVLQSFIAKDCIEKASREQVARYLQRDVRTLTRWKNQYDDFPKARHYKHREVSYNWTDVVRWKLKHKDIYNKV